MIVSSGYNIAGPEVESALLGHAAVAECGVVGAPDEARGMIVKAYVVLAPGVEGDAALATELQDHVKRDDRALQISARDRVRRAIAEDRNRQAAAVRAAADGAGRDGRCILGHGRGIDASDGELVVSKPKAPTLAVLPTTKAGTSARPQVLQPGGWPMPKGYANGMAADGRIVVTGGVIGWDKHERSGRRFCRAGPPDPGKHRRRFSPKAGRGPNTSFASPGMSSTSRNISPT